jgi:MinD superfamily P-loop ATPase
MREPIPFAGMVEIDEPETIYCSSCLSYKPFDAGQVIQTAHKNLKRFKCAECLAKISARRYQGKS